MRILVILLTLCASTLTISAQRNHSVLKERMESRKVAFLSDKLELTTEEAQAFFPVYNAYTAEVENVRAEGKDMFKNSNIEDKDADAFLSKTIEIEQELLDIKKKYIQDFKGIIGSKKTLDFFRMERKFKEKLLRDFKERRKEKGKRKEKRGG